MYLLTYSQKSSRLTPFRVKKSTLPPATKFEMLYRRRAARNNVSFSISIQKSKPLEQTLHFDLKHIFREHGLTRFHMRIRISA